MEFVLLQALKAKLSVLVKRRSDSCIRCFEELGGSPYSEDSMGVMQFLPTGFVCEKISSVVSHAQEIRSSQSSGTSYSKSKLTSFLMMPKTNYILLTLTALGPVSLALAMDTAPADPAKALEACQKERVAAEKRAEEALKALGDAQSKVQESLRLADMAKSLQAELEVLRARKPAEQSTEGNSTVGAQQAIGDLDKCLSTATDRARLLSSLVKDLQSSKMAAEQQSTQKQKELAGMQDQLKRATEALDLLKREDGDRRRKIEELNRVLADNKTKSEAEALKLASAAKDLTAWQDRARKAEDNMKRTEDTLRATDKAAKEAQALGLQYQNKITEQTNFLATVKSQLTERDQRLTTLQAQTGEKTKNMESELISFRQQSEESAKAFRDKSLAYDELLQNKLATERELTRLKGELVLSKNVAEKATADWQIRIKELEASATALAKEKDLAEGKVKELTDGAKATQDRLEAALVAKEKIQDELSISRADLRRSQQSFSLTQETERKEKSNQLLSLQGFLEAKEKALQEAYADARRSKELLQQAEGERAKEAAARKSLSDVLAKLNTELESSKKRACDLQSQLVEIEQLGIGAKK